MSPADRRLVRTIVIAAAIVEALGMAVVIAAKLHII